MKQDNNIILSIIVPIFNVDKYLDNFINCVLENDLSNIEVLLVNDGSTDNSEKIATKYAHKDSHIFLFNKKNEGVSSARNYGIKKSRGKWLWFMDADDAVKSECFIDLKEILRKANPDILLFKYRKFSNKKINIKESDVNSKNNICSISKEEAMATLLNPNFASYPWNKILKKNLFNNIKFPSKRIFTEDMAIMYKVYDKSESFYFYDDYLYFYRQHSGSLSSNLTDKKIQDAALSNFEMYNFFKNKYPSLVSKIEKNTTISLISYFHRLSYKKIKEHRLWMDYLKHLDVSNYNFRYKIEIISVQYAYPIFKLIGNLGKIKRILTK